MIKIIGITGGEYTGKKIYTGVKRVGKDTFADMIKNKYSNSRDVHIISLASPIKDWFESNYHLSRKVYDNDQNKEKAVDDKWTYRLLLEKFGTDVVRDGLSQVIPSCKNFWIQKLLNKIDRINISGIQKATAELFDLSYEECFIEGIIKRYGRSYIDLQTILLKLLNKHEFPPLPVINKPIIIVIPDIRFYNEYEVIKSIYKENMLMLRIERYSNKLISDVSHSSNIVDLNIDSIVIENNGTIEELENNGLKIVQLFLN